MPSQGKRYQGWVSKLAKLGIVIGRFRGRPRAGDNFTPLLQALRTLSLKHQNRPSYTLRAATPSRAPHQAPLEIGVCTSGVSFLSTFHRNNRKGGTASFRSRTCVKRNVAFGARFKGLSLYFLYQNGKLIRIKTGLDTYLIRIQTRTPLWRYPPYDYSNFRQHQPLVLPQTSGSRNGRRTAIQIGGTLHYCGSGLSQGSFQRTTSIPFDLGLYREAPDTFNFLRQVMRAIFFRPKCSHRCVSLKETTSKLVRILKHTTKNSAEQTAMRMKWFKHIAISTVQEHLLKMDFC